MSDEMRAEFEESLSQGFWSCHVFSFVRNNDGTYLELATQLCWLTWQAALEHKPEVSEEIDPVAQTLIRAGETEQDAIRMAAKSRLKVSKDQIEECGESYVSIPYIELFNLRSENADLKSLRVNLKTGEYDGVDIMRAWLVIDRLIKSEAENEALKAENVRLQSACDNLRYTAKQALDALYFHTAHTRPIDSTFSAISALNTALKEQAK